MCCREVALGVQGNACRASGIVHEGAIEEGFTWWWCHLAAVCVLSCLYLLWDGHGASGNGGYPWVLWDGGCNTQLRRGKVLWPRRLTGVTYPVNIYVVIDGISALFSDGTCQSLGNLANDPCRRDVHFP